MANTSTTSNDCELVDDFVDAGMNEIAARILVAALSLFAEKGYAATTVREIVSRADVTNPMLYYYFDSKEGVFVALIEVLFDSMADTVEEIVDEEPNLRDQLREIARAYFNTCREQPETVRFIYSVLFGPIRSRPDFDIPESHETIDQLVASTIEAAIDRGEFHPAGQCDASHLTDRFMGLVNNHLMGAFAVLDHRCDDKPISQCIDDYLGEEALEEMLDFYFRGAGELAVQEKS